MARMMGSGDLSRLKGGSLFGGARSLHYGLEFFLGWLFVVLNITVSTHTDACMHAISLTLSSFL
jgi:hypothetical protein